MKYTSLPAYFIRETQIPKANNLKVTIGATEFES
jgi:hypothetical protein